MMLHAEKALGERDARGEACTSYLCARFGYFDAWQIFGVARDVNPSRSIISILASRNAFPHALAHASWSKSNSYGVATTHNPSSSTHRLSSASYATSGNPPSTAPPMKWTIPHGRARVGDSTLAPHTSLHPAAPEVSSRASRTFSSAPRRDTSAVTSSSPAARLVSSLGEKRVLEAAASGLDTAPRTPRARLAARRRDRHARGHRRARVSARARIAHERVARRAGDGIRVG